jgi:hypothetical protein
VSLIVIAPSPLSGKIVDPEIVARSAAPQKCTPAT